MNLIQLLEEKRARILSQAIDALTRAHLVHYEAAGTEHGQERLEALYDLTLGSIKAMNLSPLIGYVDNIAQARFASGFELQEVQTAFNVLGESIWKEIVDELPPSELAAALGLVNTFLRAGKDALANKYVKLAAQTKTPSLNIPALYSYPGYEGCGANTSTDPNGQESILAEKAR